jgi:hypothetical protein
VLNHLLKYQKALVILLIYSFVLLLSIQFYDWIRIAECWFVKMLLNFALLWVLVLVGFSFFQIFKYFRFPDFIYKRLKFETESFFKLLLVPVFQKALVNSFFRHLNPRVYLKGRGREYIKVYHEETKQSGSSHMLSGAAALAYQVVFYLDRDFLSLVFLSFFNILFNLYPLLLQRMNRFNLERKLPNLFSVES